MPYYAGVDGYGGRHNITFTAKYGLYAAITTLPRRHARCLPLAQGAMRRHAYATVFTLCFSEYASVTTLLRHAMIVRYITLLDYF